MDIEALRVVQYSPQYSPEQRTHAHEFSGAIQAVAHINIAFP